MAASGRDDHIIDVNDGKKCIFRVPKVLRRQNSEVVSIGPFHMRKGKEEDEGKKCKKCIFRVPKVLRRQKSEAYTPDVISVGPFHYRAPGKEDDFQLMEQVKQRYSNEILSHMNNISMKKLTEKVTELSDQKNEGKFEERVRGFYAEKLDDHISSEDFIVDGCFLIQLFRKCNNSKLRDFDDPVFNMDCMFHFLCHDILLLENQLPWFVIQALYRLTHDKYPEEHEPSLSVLILEALSKLPSLKHSCSSYKNHLINKHEFHCDDDVLHILDLIRTSIVFPLQRVRSKKVVYDDILVPNQHQMHTATALSKADIKFQNVPKESIMDIRFKVGGFWRNGVVQIPQLNVGMSSETLFRNLIALEQCYHGYSNEITSYAILMDNLISSQEDMELLCKAKVIGNWLSDEDGCNFFNNLHKDIPHNKFCYVDLCKRVNDRYEMKWYTWLALLKIEKFSNPWKILAFGFAIVAVFLSSWASINNIRRYM